MSCNKQRKQTAQTAGFKYGNFVYGFLDRLVDKRNIVIDSSWKQNIDSEQISYDFGLYDFGDTPQSVLNFPFKDIKFQYHRERYFSLGKYDFPADSDEQRSNPAFNLEDLIKFRFLNGEYLVFTAKLKQFNGYGGAITFNYFFSISGHPVQDIYTNFCNSFGGPVLYGDLNGDIYLDRVVFDGFYMPEDTNSVTVKAQSFINNKWVTLKNSAKEDYFIRVETDRNMDSFNIVKSCWLNAMKAVNDKK